MNRVIVIAGPSGGGKSTHSDGFVVRTKGAVKLSLATYLKDKAVEFGWDGVKDEAGRMFLQNLQFKLKKEEGENVFVSRLLQKADALFASGEANTVVVDDHRFAIERAGFEAWHAQDKDNRCVQYVKFHDTLAQMYWEKCFLANLTWAMHCSELEWRAFPKSSWDLIYNNDRELGIEPSINKLCKLIEDKYLSHWWH